MLISRMSACNSVIASEVDKFLNVLGADVVASAENYCVNRNFCPKFEALHSVKSGDNIAAYCECAVVFEEHYIVLFKVRFDSVGNFNC